MAFHLGEALVEAALLRLVQGDRRHAETLCQEALEIARRFGGRILTWQAHHTLGTCFERSLEHRRALTQYRAASSVLREMAADIRSPHLRDAFLRQRCVRSALANYIRIKELVGRRARFDVAALNRREAVSRKMLASLSEIGQKLASELDLHPLLAQILDLAIENTGAERGVIFLRDEASSEFHAPSARGVGGLDLEDLSTFSRSVLKQAAEGRAILTVDVGQDPLLQRATSITVNEIKSILCLPMRARGRVTGVLYLDTQRRQRMFTEKDRAFVEAFAGQAAVAIENARLFGSIRAENGRLRREVTGRFRELVGTSDIMEKLRDLLAGVADSDSTVLLTGESGTGKEVVARAIHLNGSRTGARFVPVDCGALPEHLLEAELFGCRRGAFTGADRDRVGLIEAANGGTVFLDEITNTSLALQARLLRVLQEREVRRLGENEVRKVDVRVIAATNAVMEQLVAEGKFREDLFYRLNVVRVEVPALRERRDDIPLLAQHFLEQHMAAGKVSANAGSSSPPVPKKKIFGPGVLEVLSRRDWPGNVRELENIVERLRVLTQGTIITLADVTRVAAASLIRDGGTRHPNVSGRVRAFPGTGGKTGEQLLIEDALRRFGGDKAKAAKFIGWNRQKLYRRLKTYAIPSRFGKAA